MPTLDEAIGGATPDPLDAAILGGDTDKRRRSLYGAVRQNPDEYGKATQLSRAVGVPAPVVARNLQDVEQRAKLDALDAAILPGSAVDRTMQNPDFANLSHDDVANLSETEALFNPRMGAGKIDGPAFKRRAIASAVRGPDASFTSVVSGVAKSLAQGGEGARQGLRAEFADLFGFRGMREDALSKTRHNALETELSSPEFESSTARGIYGGGTSLLRALPGLAASIVTRSPAVGLSVMGVQTQPEAYGKYRARGATPGEAVLGSGLETGTEILTELAPMGFLVNRLGKAGAGEFLSGLLAREIPSEQVATLVQDAVDTAIANPDKTWGDYLKERPGAAYETLVATVTQGGAMGAINEIARRVGEPQAQADQAMRDADALAQLGGLAAASKVRSRDQQSFAEFVQAASADGPVQDIYLDARTLQQAGIDPAALAAMSPTVAAQLPEAMETGGDLVVPIAEYASIIAGTDLDAALLPHLRTSEDALSQDEAQRFYQGQEEQFREAAAKVMEEKADDDVWQASAKAVETKMFEQLKGAGRFNDDVNRANATLARDFYVTTAQRLGITPEEAYARYPLQVRAESVAGDSRMGQEGVTVSREGANNFMSAKSDAGLVGGHVRGGALRITHAQVEEAMRGKGEGIRLYTALIDEAHAAGLKVVSDSTVEAEAVRVYEALQRRGYEVRRLDGGTLEDGAVYGKGAEEPAFEVLPRKVTATDSGYTADNNLNQSGQDESTRPRTGTDRPGLQTGQDVHATIAGGPPREGWAESTRVRRTDGKPAVVYRGASRFLEPGDFGRDALGHATGNPSGGLGVWFTPNRDEAGRYGDVERFHLDIRKPKVIKIEDLPGFDSTDAAHAFREELRAAGYDGIAVDARHVGGPLHFVAFDAETVVLPPAAKPLDMGQFFQSQQGAAVPQTETPEFKRWFGDSKVVTEDGKPLVVYHATDADFSEFQPSMRSGKLMYFAMSKAAAKKGAGKGRTKNILEVYVSARKPYNTRDTAMQWQEAEGLGGYFGGDWLKENGFDSVWVKDEAGVSIAVVDPAQIKSAIGNSGAFDPANPNILAQPDQAGNRGEISFSKDITQTPSVITLFKNADLSTFLHEMGHFQLEVLAHIASRPDAPQSIVDDMNAALKWFKQGLTVEAWNAMSLEEKRPYHEQFARGFEAYLFEGKAPSQELQGVFQRFRAWLVNVYKSVRALNVEISDDIRGVFDRLLATEAQIKAAEEARNFTPLFGSMEEMGGAPDAWAEYQRLGSEASRDAQDELQKRSLRDMQWLTNARGRILKQLQRDAKDKRKAAEDEVRAEVQAMPIYAVQHFLKRGEMTGPDGEQIKAEKGHRLDNASLAEMYPEDMLARPALERLQGMTRNDGLHPDLVAEMFGFTSGDHLVREILAAEPEAEIIEGMTDQRMLERHGDITNPDTLARAADEAIHNEVRARFVATELKTLAKAQTPVRAMTKAAKDFAEGLISRKKVKDIKPAQHATAETRAAKNAERALAKGDRATAEAEKRNQLVQNYATRAAYNAIDETEKAVKYLRKFDTDGTRKNLDTEYTEQIDALLERFDLRSSVTNKDAVKRASLIDWYNEQQRQGFEPDIPPELLSEAMRKPYRELTLEELRGLVDTVKQIEHLGRLKKKLLTAKDEREFKAIRDEIAASIEEHAKGVRDLRTRNTTGAMLKDAGNRFLAMHRKMASVAREMDGFNDGGPMWEYFIRTMNEAGDHETSMRAEATAKLYELVKPLTKSGKMGGKGQYFPTLKGSFNREERIAIALNLGNAGNTQRLLDGEGWTMTRLAPLLNTITPEEADFVQAVWDFFESYRPQIGAKEKRVYGKEPEWTEAVPVTLGGKQLRGGYYPIKYDPQRSGQAEQHAEAEAARQQMRSAYTSSTTRRSFTKTRAEAVVGRPLIYSFAGLYQGANEVIHDLSWHEWLIDANRLLRSLDAPIRDHYGPESVTVFKKAIEDIAAGDIPAENVFERGLNHARTGATIAGLGWNLTTSLLQPLGLTQSAVRIGPGWVAKGLGQWIKAPLATVEEINEKSGMMRDRARTQQREINEIQNQVRGSGLDPVRSTFFVLIQKMQMVADVPTWLGAYEKHTAQGETEERAVALADQAVLDAQGGGQMKDLSQIQRGHPALKLFTNFYSFFNVAYNLGVEKTKEKAGNPKLWPSLALDYLMLYSVPAVLGSLLKHALTGGEDDDENLAEKLIAEQISYLLGLMVGVREMTAAAQKFVGVEQFNTSYGGPAGLRLFQEIDKLGKQVGQGEIDGALLKSANNVGGIIFHYPSGQINRTAEGAAAMIEGKASPAALIVGPPR